MRGSLYLLNPLFLIFVTTTKLDYHKTECLFVEVEKNNSSRIELMRTLISEPLNLSF